MEKKTTSPHRFQNRVCRAHARVETRAGIPGQILAVAVAAEDERLGDEEPRALRRVGEHAGDRRSFIILKEYASKNKLEALLKINSQETENLTTIDENGKLKIFNKVEEIVKHFVDIRLSWYDIRKSYLITKLERELLIISNKSRFIKEIIDGKLKVNNVPKKTIISYLENNKYDEIDGSYNYLLNMPIYSLTKERFDELLKQEADKIVEKKIIEGTDPKAMYLTDLETLNKTLK